jgi:hypothetical protein
MDCNTEELCGECKKKVAKWGSDCDDCLPKGMTFARALRTFDVKYHGELRTLYALHKPTEKIYNGWLLLACTLYLTCVIVGTVFAGLLMFTNSKNYGLAAAGFLFGAFISYHLANWISMKQWEAENLVISQRYQASN